MLFPVLFQEIKVSMELSPLLQNSNLTRRKKNYLFPINKTQSIKVKLNKDLHEIEHVQYIFLLRKCLLLFTN